MPQELTLETLAKNIADINVKLGSFKADHTEEKQKKKEAKKAQEKKEEEEHKEAKRASRTAALKIAMDEKDDEKRDAAIRKAMEDDEHKNHSAQNNDDEKKNHEAQEKEDEEKEHVASIIEDQRQDYITKILTANSIMNPNGLKEIKEGLKTASLTEVKKTWKILQPAFEGAVAQPIQQEKFVPFFANVTPSDIDGSTLTASSPDSEFAKFTTKELLEMSR